MTGLKSQNRDARRAERIQDEPREAHRAISGHLRIIQTGPDKVEYAGLCAICNLKDTCTFPRSREHPVHECDEFDGRGEGIRLHVMGPPAQSAPRPPDGVKWDGRETAPTVWGLCTTCEKRETCDFPRTHGGVWQCEEFE